MDVYATKFIENPAFSMSRKAASAFSTRPFFPYPSIRALKVCSLGATPITCISTYVESIFASSPAFPYALINALHNTGPTLREFWQYWHETKVKTHGMEFHCSSILLKLWFTCKLVQLGYLYVITSGWCPVLCMSSNADSMLSISFPLPYASIIALKAAVPSFAPDTRMSLAASCTLQT